MKPGPSEVPRPSHLHTGHSSGQAYACYVLSCPGDGASGCERLSPHPWASGKSDHITNTTANGVVSTLFQSCEEGGRPPGSGGPCPFQAPPPLCLMPPPQWWDPTAGSGGGSSPSAPEAGRCVPHKCHEASFFNHHEPTNA